MTDPTTPFDQFGFGRDDDDIGGKNKQFKAEAGRTYRVSFAWWKLKEDGTPDLDAPTPEFNKAPRNFGQGLGYVINQGPEYTKLFGGEAPRKGIGTVIVVWPTDRNGALDKARLGSGDFEVMPWVISEDKFEAIKPIHVEFPMGSHDLQCKCTDTKYQKMTFNPCRESLLRKILENPKTSEFAKQIMEKVQMAAAEVPNAIGRVMTLDQIREKLTGAPTDTAASAAISTEDIDSVVDDILDT